MEKDNESLRGAINACKGNSDILCNNWDQILHSLFGSCGLISIVGDWRSSWATWPKVGLFWARGWTWWPLENPSSWNYLMILFLKEVEVSGWQVEMRAMERMQPRRSLWTKQGNIKGLRKQEKITRGTGKRKEQKEPTAATIIIASPRESWDSNVLRNGWTAKSCGQQISWGFPLVQLFSPVLSGQSAYIIIFSPSISATFLTVT